MLPLLILSLLVARTDTLGLGEHTRTLTEASRWNRGKSIPFSVLCPLA
jgi:hypothetical protein